MSKGICVITGASGGIGSALAHQAAERGYDLVLHGRSESSIANLATQVTAASPKTRVTVVVGDLGSAQGARGVAEQISEVAGSISILFNNAGVLLDRHTKSPDGLEIHTQVNLIAPFILMHVLKENIARSKGTIINVSSGSIFRARDLDIDQLVKPDKFIKLAGAYSRSKLAMAAVTKALGKQFANDGVVIASGNPGPSKTGMTSSGGLPFIVKLLSPLVYGTAEKGAARIFAAFDAATTQTNAGGYFDGTASKELPKLSGIQGLDRELVKFCKSYADLPPEFYAHEGK